MASTELERTLRIIEQSSGGCPICGWIWWAGDAPCLSCERNRESRREEG